jgi:hypothetical protein
MQGMSFMSAQQNNHSATLRFALFAVAALALAGCTSGPSAGVPQEGALRTGVYPNFGIMPRGETKQLTFEEKDQIAGTLSSAKAGPVWCMSSLSDARKSPFKKLTANDERFALAGSTVAHRRTGRGQRRNDTLLPRNDRGRRDQRRWV